ncbi:MAG TPA: ABC transporter permease [Acidimicrobiales bacterium]
MRWRDYLGLSLRSLRRSKSRTILTVAAIVIGATGITIMLTFVTSLKSFVVQHFTQSGQILQIQVAQGRNLSFSGFTGNNNGPTPGAKVLSAASEAKVAALPHVTSVSATFSQGGYIEYVAFGSKKLQPNIVGYQVNAVIKPQLVAGRDLVPTDRTGAVLLTQDYANAMGFKGTGAGAIGKTIYLHTNYGYSGEGATLPSVLPPQHQCAQNQRNCNGGPSSGLPAINLAARVVGIVSKGYANQTIFIPLSWSIAISNQSLPRFNCNQNGCGNNTGGWVTPSVASYIASNGGYNSLVVEVDNSANVPHVATQIRQLGFGAATGLSQMKQQTNAANLIGLALGGLGLIALFIAALGVMNTMVMSVLERTREIGVMRALGARRSTIRRLFTFEALVLGFFGGVFGVLLGSLLLLFAKPILANSMKGTTLPNFTVPIWLIFVVVALTSFIGFISGVLPSRRAARLDPIEALRYE